MLYRSAMFYAYADIISPGKGAHVYVTTPPEGNLLVRALLIVIVSLLYGVVHYVSIKCIYGNNSIHAYCAFFFVIWVSHLSRYNMLHHV